LLFCYTDIKHGVGGDPLELSVNSPTGQTSQRIFTVDSLKDADLRKYVPFGGIDDE